MESERPSGTHASASVGRILIADDDTSSAAVIGRSIRRLGYEVVLATDGRQALEMISRNAPDVILLDVEMPHVDGFEVCRRIKKNPATRLIPTVLITGLCSVEDRITGIEAGADDFLTKPFHRLELEARVRSLTRLKRYTDALESAESVILSLALTVEARDRYTQGHCERLARFATALGAAVGLNGDDQAALFRGGYLHDIGKIGIPDDILLKPRALTLAEFDRMKQHTVIGDRLCGELQSLRLVRPIIRQHHERNDGGGYPDGLRGNEISLLAQIVSIADVYDAITTDRPYRPARTPLHAYDELRRDAACGRMSPELVEVFVDLAQRGKLSHVSPEMLSLRPAR